MTKPWPNRYSEWRGTFRDSQGGDPMVVADLERKLKVLGGLAVLLLVTTPLAQAEEKPVEPVTIKKVVSAKLEMSKDALTVTAVGEVPTSGYTKPTLTRVTYIKVPDDGIQDYTLRAIAPDGVAAQVISQV